MSQPNGEREEQDQESELSTVIAPEVGRQPRTVPYHKDHFVAQLKARYTMLSKQLAEYKSIEEEMKNIGRAIKALSGESLSNNKVGRPLGSGKQPPHKPVIGTPDSIRPTRLNLLQLMSQQKDWITSDELPRLDGRSKTVVTRDASELVKSGLMEQQHYTTAGRRVALKYAITTEGRQFLSAKPTISKPGGVKKTTGHHLPTYQLLQLLAQAGSANNLQLGEMAEQTFGVPNTTLLRSKIAVQTSTLRTKKLMTTDKDKIHTITKAGRKQVAQDLAGDLEER